MSSVTPGELPDSEGKGKSPRHEWPLWEVFIRGQHGLSVIGKVFGVILLAISVKLFATNINGLF